MKASIASEIKKEVAKLDQENLSPDERQAIYHRISRIAQLAIDAIRLFGKAEEEQILPFDFLDEEEETEENAN